MNYSILDKLNILKASIINNYKIQVAHFTENWASIGSTFFHTVTTILFTNILYANVNTFAGYNKNDMYLLIFIGQVNFYIAWLWSMGGVRDLIKSVRSGELDTLLVKPMPILFYVTFKHISFINRLKDSLPNLIILGVLVNWSHIHTSWKEVLFSLIIFVCGQIAWHCFTFIFALPVFFMGHADQVSSIASTLGVTFNIPLEGFPSQIKYVFITIIPTLIAAQISTSVLLGRSNSFHMLLLSVVVALLFLVLKKMGWKLALQNYTSASS